MARVNLKTNPSFQNGLETASALNGASLAVIDDYAFYGTHSLQVTKSDDNNSGVAFTDAIPVVAGSSYAISSYVRLPNVLPPEEEANLVLRLDWRNSVNTTISTDESTILTLDQDLTWDRLSGVWIAPVGATVGYVQIAQVTGGTDGAIFLVDAILVEQSSYVGLFINNFTQSEENAIVNKALTPQLPQTFGGAALNADVIINDLVLNTIDEQGVVWICTDIQGWWGNSAPELPDIPRGTEDGSYDVSGRYQARVLTLTGVFFPPSVAALGEARDRLVSAINLVRRGGWLRTNEEPTKAAFVRLSGQPQIQTVNSRGRTEFSIGLKAGDPIKYEWDDSDPDGSTMFHLDGADIIGTLFNAGTAEVTGLLSLTGPLGADTTIYNAATDETMTIVQALRGAGVVATVSSASVTDNIATLKTTDNHGLQIGDKIAVSGVSIVYDTVGYEATVLGASNVFPYTVSYAVTSDNLDEESITGIIILAENDVLVIDTYNREVSFNGSNIGHRSKLETLTDWIKFAPGDNIIEFGDDADEVPVSAKSLTGNIAMLTTDEHIHYLVPGENVVVALAEEALLSRKSLTGNVVTLTTVDPHGFSVGDTIDVNSTEESIVDQKAASTTVATLRTVDTHGISVSDTIVVALPESAVISIKALTSNVVTLTTQNAHGFSAGDEVVVALPASATITNKALTSNQATLTTSAAHNFQIGDSITVTLPTLATVTNKAKSGPNAVITTSSAHGFSVGDSVVMALPAAAVLTDSRSAAGSAGNYLMTVNTSSAHNFSVGDKVTVATGLTDTKTVTNRSATTTHCTLTMTTHHFSVGEKITVSGVTSRYNGTFYITGVTGTTVTYANAGVTESSTASSGSVVNITISTYYNGSNKIIETIPSSTSFTYREYGQETASTSTAAGSGGTVTNTTNTAFNGTKTLLSASGSQFTYTL